MHVRLRPARLDDVQPLAAFMGRCTVVHQGVRRESAEEMRQRLTRPGCELQRDTFLAEADAEILGFGQVWSEAPHVVVVSYARVRPDATGGGIGTALLAAGAARAEELLHRAQPDARMILEATSWPRDGAAAPLLEGFGFAPVRYLLLMTVALSDDLEQAEPPLGTSIAGLDEAGAADLHRLHAVRSRIFADQQGGTVPSFDEWLHEYTGRGDFDPSLWFVARDGGGLAGFVLCQPDLPEDSDAGYVCEIGVASRARGRGLALALLGHAFSEFRRRGKHRASLHVDADNPTGAVRLYERAGMTSDPRLVVWERVLRE